MPVAIGLSPWMPTRPSGLRFRTELNRRFFFCNAVGLPFGVLQFIPPFAFLFSIFFCNASPLSFGSELYMYFVFRVVFAAFGYIEMGYHWKGEAFFCGLL